MKKIIIFLMVILFCASLNTVMAKKSTDSNVILIDDMSKMNNSLGGRCAVYQRHPSRAGFSKVSQKRDGKEDKVLKIRFDKKGEGGPYGQGGWCGYYTIVKKGKKFLDLTGFKKLTLWVKGEQGGEKFKVGIADQQYESMGDSAKSDDISNYLKDKKITTQWQKAEIPLEDIFVEWTQIASLAINFETDLYENGAAKGTVYIDDIQFEK